MNQTASENLLSLHQLLDPHVLADPYPLYRRLRTEAPVLWDPYLHVWVVSRYSDVLTVLTRFSADRTPSPEFFETLGAPRVNPIAKVMLKQMLFVDAPAHARLRTLCARAFMPSRLRVLRDHMEKVALQLIDNVLARGTGRMELLSDFAEPLPALVTTEMLGVPVEDHRELKDWTDTFVAMLGNLQHNPQGLDGVISALENLIAYFQDAIRDQRKNPREGLLHTLLSSEVNGDRLTDEEVIANCIVIMGGQESVTNLICNGLLTLLRHPEQLDRLRAHPEILPAAVEELLRYESPVQHTARIAPDDVVLGGTAIKKKQAVIAVIGAANRDPEQFSEPDRLDFARPDNRHLAFGWSAHFCFGAPFARLEGKVAFETLLRRFPSLQLTAEKPEWLENLGARGLRALPLSYETSR